ATEGQRESAEALRAKAGAQTKSIEEQLRQGGGAIYQGQAGGRAGWGGRPDREFAARKDVRLMRRATMTLALGLAFASYALPQEAPAKSESAASEQGDP